MVWHHKRSKHTLQTSNCGTREFHKQELVPAQLLGGAVVQVSAVVHTGQRGQVFSRVSTNCRVGYFNADIDTVMNISLRAAGHYLFSELEGTGSLFTRHGLFVICLLKVEEDCCSKMKTKSFQHYILTVTHFPLGSGMLKRPYSHFRTTIFFNFQQTYDK